MEREPGVNERAVADHLRTTDLPEAMSPFLAVFNYHVNDADKRARAQLARTERGRLWLGQVERIERERNGIMGIFDDWTKPTGVRRYIKLVTKFVNENRAPTPDRSGGADKTAKQGLANGESGLPEGSSR